MPTPPLEILCLAPSPAVDRTSIVPSFQLGQIHRPRQVMTLAGGKGVNVARAVMRLGGRARAGLICAGHNGAWVLDALRSEGIPAFAAWTRGETRLCHSIVDPDSGRTTELYENGIPVSAQTWQNFLQLVEDRFPYTQYLALSGNLPPGAPADGTANLVARARRAGLSTLVDSYGASLKLSLQEKPYLVKINASEAGELLGKTIHTATEAAAAGASMRQLGAGLAVITLGKDGAVAVTPGGAWHVSVPAVPALSAVGSGDSFLAGLAVGLQAGQDLPEALRLAAGAGAANTLQIGAGVFDAATASHLAASVQIQRIV